MSKKGLLERLEKDIVLGAEGYVFELERRGYVKAGAFVPEVVVDFPEALRQLHREFLRAGSDVIEALTYYAHREKLKSIGREGELEEINKQALTIAKEVAAEGDALVAGNICNTWVYDPQNPKESGQLVREMYDEQIKWAHEAGVDFIIAETIEYLGEALIALEVIKKYNLPAMVTFAATFDKSRDGHNWDDACKKLEDEGADIVGLNCIRGPKTMFPILQEVRDKVSGYVAAQPVPYHTDEKHPAFQLIKKENGDMAFPTELDPYLLTRNEMAEFAVKAKEIGVNYIGICCGAGPHHVRAMAEAIGRTVPASRYSPDMSLHSQFGNKKVVKDHNQKTWEKGSKKS